MRKVTAYKIVRAGLLCAAMLWLGGCEKQERPDVKEPGVFLESKEGKFAVTLPDSFPPPELSSKQVPTDIGEINMKLYTSAKSDGSAFIISYNDYPEHAFVKETPKMMDDIRDAVLGSMDAKLEEQKDFTFEGHSARTLNFSIEAEGRKGYGRLQYFIARPRLYQMIFLALDDQVQRDHTAIERSFASFKLLK